jgi:hypothetical protein
MQDICFRTQEDLMSMKATGKTQQITVDEIATVAATGVARALEARQAAGLELSSEELAHINGGSISAALVSPGSPPSFRISPEIWGFAPPSFGLPSQSYLRTFFAKG